MRKCPYCEAEVSETAKKCRYCGEFLIENNQKNSIASENESKGEENMITYKKSFRIFLINIVKDIVIVAFILGLGVPHDDEDTKAFLIIFLCVVNEIIRLITNLVIARNQKGNSSKKDKFKLGVYLKSFFKFLNCLFRDFMIVFMASYLVLSTDTLNHIGYPQNSGVSSTISIIMGLAFLYEIIRFIVDIVKISKSKK